MTQDANSSNGRNGLLIAVAGLGILAVLMFGLWLRANTLLGASEEIAATNAANAEQNATEVAENAAALDDAAATSTAVAGELDDAAAASTAIAGELDDAAATNTAVAGELDDAAATNTAVAGELEDAAATNTAAAEDLAERDDTIATRDANIATAEAELDGLAATTTQEAGERRSAAIASESVRLQLAADATANAANAANAAATATQAAQDNRSAAIASENERLQLAADATANAANAADAAATATQAAQDNRSAAITSENERLQLAADATAGAATASALQQDYDDLQQQATSAAATVNALVDALSTPTVLPSPSPTPTPEADTNASTPEDVLALAGISMEDARLVTTVDDLNIDLTGLNDTILTEPINSGQQTSFLITATLTWGTDAPNDYCGFAFHRQNADNYYTAEVDRQDGVRFFSRFNGEWSQIAADTTNALDTGAGASNSLALVVEADTFTLYANGTDLLRTTDERLAEGEVQIMGGTFDDSDDSACVFSDVQLYTLLNEDEVKTGNATTHRGVAAGTTEDGAYILGSPDAPITIVQFADFRCPFCQQYRPVTDAIIEEEVLTGRARFEFRMLPTADREAIGFRAIECAVEQRTPAAFWPLHDVMYDVAEANNGEPPGALVSDFIEAAELDEEAMAACIDTADQYITDQAIGFTTGVTGTPAMFFRTPQGDLVPIIPGQFSGPVPIDEVRDLIEGAQ